jgi:hypothetical protein
VKPLSEIVEKYNLWDRYVCITQVGNDEDETLYIDGELIE